MPGKKSVRLVIDASVARAAGGPSASFPLSKRCRDLLAATLTICHRVVLTPEILDEWKRHRSGFARHRLEQMFARKKAEYRETTALMLGPEDVDRVAFKPKERESFLKDVHLLEAALGTDRTVVSLDDTARGLFARSSRILVEVRRVIWVNPSEEGGMVWLVSRGAAADKARMLVHWEKGYNNGRKTDASLRQETPSGGGVNGDT